MGLIAKWSKAPYLKYGNVQAFRGSNPLPSVSKNYKSVNNDKHSHTINILMMSNSLILERI